MQEKLLPAHQIVHEAEIFSYLRAKLNVRVLGSHLDRVDTNSDNVVSTFSASIYHSSMPKDELGRRLTEELDAFRSSSEHIVSAQAVENDKYDETKKSPDLSTWYPFTVVVVSSANKIHNR